MSAHHDFIVVARRRLVAATCVNHRDAAAIVFFHITIRKPELPQQFDATDFEPDKIIRMINNTHLVGFCVPHPHASLTDHGMMVSAFTHSPPQRGLRFSRNDEMPSRKSLVARIAAFSVTAHRICSSSSTRAWLLSRRLVYVSDVGLFSISCDANSRARSI